MPVLERLEKPVKELFPRLFYLSNKQEGTAREMGRWVDGRWRWELGWRRDILEREKSGVEEELYGFLQNFSVTEGSRCTAGFGKAPRQGNRRLIVNHFVSFSGLGEDGKSRRKLGGLWICVVWVVWPWQKTQKFSHIQIGIGVE